MQQRSWDRWFGRLIVVEGIGSVSRGTTASYGWEEETSKLPLLNTVGAFFCLVYYGVSISTTQLITSCTRYL
jgi:hypothetical protein